MDLEKLLGPALVAATFAAVTYEPLPDKAIHARTEVLVVRLVTAAGQSKGDEPHAVPQALEDPFTVGSAANRNVDIHVPLHLPDGARVLAMTVYGSDREVIGAASMVFQRAFFDEEKSITVASWASSSLEDEWTSKVIDEVIDASSFAYWVTVSIPGGRAIRVWSLDVVYEL